MEEILHQWSELAGTKCELCEDGAQAVDWLCLPLGVDGVELERLQVPICNECVIDLCSGVWILFYCLDCTAHHWGIEELLRNDYEESIQTMRGCPECKTR